jgi:hypothetical protein
MKIWLVSLVTLLAACGVNQSQKGSTLASNSDEIVVAVKGCYKVSSAEIAESAFPDHPGVVTLVLKANTLCLDDSLRHDGSVSRSGRLVVTAKNSAGEIVGGTWGFDVPDSQPRCPGCYSFTGLDGSIGWDGERRVFDGTAPINANLNIRPLQTTYKFILGQKVQ